MSPAGTQPMQIESRFAVPIAQIQMPDCETLNARLKSQLLFWESHEGERSSIPTSVAKHAVYESDFSLFERDHPDIRQLANFCLGRVGEMIARLNNYGAQQLHELRIFAHSWYHITRYGGYTGPHNHPMASWSGVYCVCPGESSQAHHESGVLRLMDPRANIAMYLDPGNAHLHDPYAPGTIPWTFHAGQLLLFPSWLYHEVAPFWGRDERITVAFNAWVRSADEAPNAPGVSTG